MRWQDVRWRCGEIEAREDQSSKWFDREDRDGAVR